jgi:hypothetical protein
LQKYDLTQWYLTVNQSRNSTTGLSDGNYSYFASAKDNIGNENVTSRWNITIDTIFPIVNITYPFNNTLYTINISTLNYTIVDINSGYCWYSNSSGTWNSTNIQPAGNNFSNVITKEALIISEYIAMTLQEI